MAFSDKGGLRGSAQAKGMPGFAKPRLETLETREVPTVSNGNFVNELFKDLLVRSPSQAEVSNLNQQLVSGVSKNQVIDGVLASAEYRQDVVSNLYQTILGRNPDPGGLRNWVQFLSTGSIQKAQACFFASEEFFQNPTVGAQGKLPEFVDRLYQEVLFRNPDPAGRAHFLGLLAGGFSRTAVAGSIVNSPESNALLVNRAYRIYLSRTCIGQPPANLWVTQLNNGASYEQIQLGILGSPEYYQKAQVIKVLGVNYNGEPSKIVTTDPLLGPNGTDLGRTGAAWIRSFLDYSQFRADPSSLDLDIQRLQAAKKAGYNVIVNIKFNFNEKPYENDFPINSNEIEKWLNRISAFLDRIYQKCDILVIGNEPFIETPYGYRGSSFEQYQGTNYLLPFYIRAANLVHDYQQKQLLKIPLYLGAYDNLWIKEEKIGNDYYYWQQWAKPLLEFTRNTEWLAGLDLHIHQDNTGTDEIMTVFNFVDRYLNDNQLILVTEFSQVNYYLKHNRDKIAKSFQKYIPAGVGDEVYDYLDYVLKNPVNYSEWVAFLKSNEWYQSQINYLDNAWSTFNKFPKFNIGTYGIYQSGPAGPTQDFGPNEQPWFLNSLFTNQTTTSPHNFNYPWGKRFQMIENPNANSG